MRFAKITLGLLLPLAASFGCEQASSKSDEVPLPNPFHIHLQDGFDGREVVVTVDSREVYRGRPKTREEIGLAVHFPTSAATSRPVISIWMPQRQINEKRQLNLADGVGVGIQITPDRKVEFRQANGFGYE